MKKFIHIIIFLLVIPVLFSCSKNQTHYKPGTYVSLDTIIAKRTIENDKYPSVKISIKTITYFEYTKNDKLNNAKTSSNYYNFDISLYDIELGKWRKINFKINYIDINSSDFTWNFEENPNVDHSGYFSSYGDLMMEIGLWFYEKENCTVNQYWVSISDEDIFTKKYEIEQKFDYVQPTKLIIEETDKIVNDENDLLLLENDEYCTIYSNKIYRYRVEGNGDLIYYVRKIETTPFYYNCQQIIVESSCGNWQYHIRLVDTYCTVEQIIVLNGH